MSRRNPRRQASEGPKVRDDNAGDDDDDSRSESASIDDDASSSEEEEERPTKRRGAERTQQQQPRTSSRSTRFQKSMKEPKDGIRDLLARLDEVPKTPQTKKGNSSSPRHSKSPAVRHSSRRRRMHIEMPVKESDYSSEEEEEESHESEEEGEEEEEESLKIQRIVASRSETRRKWQEECKNMNTSEIDYGSRWFQKDKYVTEEDLDAFEERFLVKWADLSYMHCSWETQDDLIDQVDGAKTYLTTFFRKSENGLLFDADERNDGDYFDPGFVQIERILEVAHPDDVPPIESDDPIISKYGIVMDKAHEDFERGTGRQFLIKWENTPYAEATFEFERDLIINDIDYSEHLAAFEERSKKPSSKEIKRLHTTGDLELRRLFIMFGDESNVSEEKRDEEVKAYQTGLEKHIFKNGGQLRDYQAEGVSWLMSNYVNERSSILADEMGLGKTIQTASFINLIATRVNLRGPFLIVAPLSTIPHWYREFTGWTDLNTIVYHGSAYDREVIREMEFPFECDRPKNGVGFNARYLAKCRGRSKDHHTWMAQVVITTPEMLVTDDYTELTEVEWEVIVVDEAHRLKNHNSKLAVNLRHKDFRFRHSVLLTGTPIQNDMKELWTLLNFIDAEEFNDREDFLEQYGDIKSKEGIDELHETIRPYILRRLKEDVEKSVPPKEETLIEVELTLLQKQYYRALYEKNLTFLHKNKKKALDGPSLSNLAMQLRKCCNHPFLLNGIEEEIRKQEDPELSEGDFLAKASGKLVLLDKLLPRLKEQGHKVLLFSQFKIMLDILEDYLAARELKTERIDGSITGHKRQMAIDRFQNPSNEAEAPFVMLLSTRAGGVGINLTAADTCIIFDSDWNPQNDLQAQARCHRIGQTKSVKVYRLLTRKTYEMQMFHLASMKMGLDQAVLQGFEGGSGSREATMTKEEVERLLRHGAYDIFNEEKAGTAEAESNDFVQQDIDSILARRSKTVVHENTGTGSSAAGGTFSKASFRAPKTPNGAETKGTTEDIDIDDPDFWKKMVGEEHLNAGMGDDLAGQKRKRNKANYSEREFDQKIEGAIVMSDDGGGSSSSAEFDSDSDDESLQDGSPQSIKDLADSDAGKAAGPPVPGATKPRSKKIKKRKKEKARWGGSGMDEWSKSDINALLKALHSYGYGNLPWEDIRDKAGLSKTKYSVDAVKRMSWSIVLVIMHEAAQEDAQTIKKKAERAAEKRRESEGSSQNALGGGVLGKAPAPTAELVASKEDIEASFSKLLAGHSAWLGLTLSDATLYAQSSSPRPKEKLDRALQEYAGKEPAVRSKHGMLSLFSESLWPSLKNRGWTTEQVTEGAYSGATHYRHSGKEYRSPEAVLSAVPSIHPELTGVVESINGVMATESDKLTESAKSIGALDVTSLTAESLNQFLNMFAPLQLLVDRAQQRSLSLPRKTLSTCGFMKNAHDVVRHSKPGESGPAAINRIAMVLSPDKRMALPHPAWTPLHDAVLVQAIAKHGWIDQDRACRAITNDSSIKWGVPFDEALPASEPTALNMQALRETAGRVSEFLNVESELLEELTSFNQNLLVNGYGLTKVSEDAEWSVSDALLQNVAGAKPNENTGESDDVSDDEQQGAAGGMAELPTKKDLLKRAKSLLSRSHAPSESSTVAEAAGPTADHGFVVLDQSDPCNIFLSEMIRVLAKSSFTKNSKARNLGQKLCADAIREATFRKEANIAALMTAEKGTSLPSSAASDMGKIVDQLKLVARTMKTMTKAAKNLLKVMVGIPPLPAKAGERLFPPTGASELELVRTTQSTSRKQGQQSKKPKESAAQTHGDRAIARSTSRVLLQRKTDRDFSREVLADLELDSTEVLLLSVICCHGIPVWSADWDDPAESTGSGLQGPGSEDHVLTWFGLATIFSSVSKQWHKASLKKLEDKRAEYNEKFGHSTPAEITDSQSKLWEELEQAEIEERFKCHTIALAEECRANPVAFAKKAVMLMETVRRSMGSVETKRSTLKKIQSMAKSEHGLGPLVLNWFGKELTRWAKAFDIKDHTGRPHPFTTSTFVHDSEQYANDNRIGVHALFDRKACRSVFGQAAQQTRLRSIFLRRNEQDARAAVHKAAKHCRSIGEMWTRQPQWWEAGGTHDCQLLSSLLEGGYTGLDEAFSSMQPPGVAEEENEEANAPHPSVQMTKGAAQERANQLTRELHSIDDTADAIQHLREKIPPSVLAGAEADEEEMAEAVTDGDAASSDAAKPAHVPVQKGIDSFFKPAAAKKTDASDVIVLDEDDESYANGGNDEVQALSPAKRPAADEVVDEEASPAKKPKASA